MFAPLKAIVSRLWGQRTSPQAAAQSDQHKGWLSEEIKAYSTTRYFANPSLDNPTGETAEMRRAYRRALKEPAIKAPLYKKVYAVASQPVTVHAADSKDPKSKEAASWIDYAIGKSRGGWPRLLQDSGIHQLLEGFAIGEPVRYIVERGKYAGWWGLEAVKFKDTEHLRFTVDEYKNILSIQNFVGGQGSTPFSPKDFLHFTNLSLFESPFGISDLRAAYRACNLIEAAIKLRSILLENFSGPFLVFKQQSTTSLEAAKSALAAARARGYIVISAEDELDVENLATSAPDQFQATIEDLRKEAATAIAGAYLQMLEAEGKQGNSETHKGVSELFEWALSMNIAATLTSQLVPMLHNDHFALDVDYPTIVIGGVNPDAVKAAMDRLKMAQELKLPVKKDQAYETLQFEQPGPDDAVLDWKEEPPPDAMGGAMGGPMPGGGPDGGMGGGGGGMAPNRDAILLAMLQAASEGDTESVQALQDMMADGVPDEGDGAVQMADRSWLVRKQITDKNGNKAIRWVRPGGKDALETKGPRSVRQTQDKTNHVDSQTAVARAVNNPNMLSDEHIDGLADHILSLNKTEIAGHAKALGLKLGAKKQQLAEQLLAQVRANRDPSKALGAGISADNPTNRLGESIDKLKTAQERDGGTVQDGSQMREAFSENEKAKRKDSDNPKSELPQPPPTKGKPTLNGEYKRVNYARGIRSKELQKFQGTPMEETAAEYFDSLTNAETIIRGQLDHEVNIRERHAALVGDDTPPATDVTNAQPSQSWNNPATQAGTEQPAPPTSVASVAKAPKEGEPGFTGTAANGVGYVNGVAQKQEEATPVVTTDSTQPAPTPTPQPKPKTPAQPKGDHKAASAGIQSFIDGLPSGKLTKAELDAALAPLGTLDKYGLIEVAKATGNAGGLNERSSGPTIRKQIEANMGRLWKTSHNVNH